MIQPSPDSALERIWNASLDANNSPDFRHPDGSLNEAGYVRYQTNVIAIANAAVRADERRKTAEAIAADLIAQADDEALRPNRDSHSRLIEKWLREAALTAMTHATDPPTPAENPAA